MAPLHLFILLIPLHLLQVNSQDLSSEQTILLTLKQHWDSPPSLRWWNSTSFVCDWPEVECLFGTVTALKLVGNNIRGTIPSTLCLLKNLVSINVSRNSLHGGIPDSLHNCSKLETLDLSMNELSGTIPVELLLHKRLIHLWLRGNRFVGEIPTRIEAVRLESLDLSRNYLNGSIPDDMKNLLRLTFLDFSLNMLGGTIPMGLFEMRRLNYLSLAYNNISGQLPEQIMNLYRLQELNLTHNNLYGTVPKSLHGLTRISTLDLSDNHLSGDIENVVHMKSMNVLRLCSNGFSGKVPHEFVNQLFHENCLDPSNLCSDYREKGLPSCPLSLCSDDRIRGYLKCQSRHDESEKRFVIMILITVGNGVVGFAILYYLVRRCWLKKQESTGSTHEQIWPSSPLGEEEWRMITFQRLQFNKAEILSGLTDENLIGYGGSGKVYRVFINEGSNVVAVKSIVNPRKSDRALEKEFLAEIKTLGTIWHNNITKLLCYLSGKELKLLVYQYVENKSLHQWLHGKNSSVTRLEWPMRLHIAIGAAEGLCYMHHDCSSPIIHRDIKFPKHLEKRGRDMLAKCYGLPLAIKEVGRQLAMKKRCSESGWEELLLLLESTDLGATLEVVGSSYHQWPPKMKSCFLHLCFFKEGTTIRARKLVQVWTATEILSREEEEKEKKDRIRREEEGVINCSKSEEETSGIYGPYLYMLVRAEIIKAKGITKDHRTKNYRINPFFHRLAIKKAEEEIGFEIVMNDGKNRPSQEPRHRAFYCSREREKFMYSADQDKHLVSLFFHGGGYFETNPSYWKRFELLKILDFEDFGLNFLPEMVGALTRLKYLGLRNNYIEMIPPSLRCLKKLEVLDIALNFTVEVPDIIWEMDSLRELQMSDIICQKPLKIDTLKNLETLTYISVDNWKYELSGLEMMTSLSKLGIEDLDASSDVNKLFTSLTKLKTLDHLILRGFRFKSMPSLDQLGILRRLTQLKVDGLLTRLPSAHNFPPYIEHLTLANTCLDEDPMPELGKLGQLSNLELRNAYTGQQMVINIHNGFPRLNVLWRPCRKR